MPSFNDENAPTPQYVAGEAHRYAGQPNYKREYGDGLARCIRDYIDKGRTGYIWRLRPGITLASLRVYLNCAKAWILDHEDDYHVDVVETLRCSKFRKDPAGLSLCEVHDTEGHPTEYVSPAKRAAIPLDQLGGVTDVATSNIQVVSTESAAMSDAALAAMGKTITPTNTSMAFLPEDGDLETLHINMGAYFQDENCPEGAKFERTGLRLTQSEIAEIKSWLPELGVRGLVTQSRILVAKFYTPGAA